MRFVRNALLLTSYVSSYVKLDVLLPVFGVIVLEPPWLLRLKRKAYVPLSNEMQKITLMI